ncbi:sensor histidine kinase [Rudanella lutea]|uniref:sensor histidine kinase n=1 Tax=Rudanella lutea TaxID=451374 RepID=UPI000362F553|nr:sensor histidine kinase [Rudanella lutea]
MGDSVYVLAVTSTVVFLLLAVFIVSFALVFQRRQLENLRERSAMKAAYEEEILKAQIEMQNQTLQSIGRELHDNIGQLLSVTKLYLNQLEDAEDLTEVRPLTQKTNGVIDQTIRGVRSLSKSLDGDFIRDFGLVETLAFEIERLNGAGRLTASLRVQPDIQPLGFEREIILFRMVQEAINNLLKHAQARALHVSLQTRDGQLLLQLEDDGKGFDYDAVMNQSMTNSGAGLRNMQRRAELIGGSCTVDTAPGRGTRIAFVVPVGRSVALAV